MALAFLVKKPTLVRPLRGPDGALSYFNGNFRVWYGLAPPSGAPVTGQSTGRLLMKSTSKLTAGYGALTMPPYHVHLFQTETFYINAGRFGYRLNGHDGVLKAGQSVAIPPGAKHTFWNDAAGSADLDTTVTTAGGTRPGFDERVVRNIFGYTSSCYQAGVNPNIFQMLVFLNAADVVPADAPVALGRVVVSIGSFIGKYILGFQPYYKIFEE